MAPILKASLALLSISGAVSGTLAKKHNYGKHQKMARRTGLFEDLAKREQVAPFGYDRCGVPRTKPYVRKSGPSASRSWKACPTDSPVGASKVALVMPTVSADGASSSIDEDGVWTMTATNELVPFTDVLPTQSSSWSAEGESVWNGDNGNVALVPTDTWDRAQFAGPTEAPTWSSEGAAAPAPTSTEYSTSFVDVTSYVTPEAEASSSDAGVWNPSHAQNKLQAGFGGQDSSSSSEWVEPSPSSSSEVAAPTQEAPKDNVGRSYGAMGLAWDWLNPKNTLQNWCSDNPTKIYTWSAFPPSDALCANMEWYPQYWGPAKQGDFESQVAAGVIKPGMTILGYNEPDQPGQANLGVQDGINSFKSQITPYASQGYRITTPGCTSDDNGFNWLKSFIEGCAGQCGFSAIQTHYYGTDADNFIEYIEKIHSHWPDFPIIISEYAAETFGHGEDLTEQGSKDYLYKTQTWLKAQSYVDSYFFFGPLTTRAANGVNHNNLLITDDGAIKDIGHLYKSSA